MNESRNTAFEFSRDWVPTSPPSPSVVYDACGIGIGAVALSNCVIPNKEEEEEEEEEEEGEASELECIGCYSLPAIISVHGLVIITAASPR